MDNTSDSELINRYLQGNHRAFELLYGRYRNLLYYHLNRLLNYNNSDIDDIFQQTWIKVIDNLPKYKEQNNFGAWLKLIARNIVIDRARSAKRRGMVFTFNSEILIETCDENESVFPWYELAEEDKSKTLDEAMQSLSREQRNVYELRCQNLSFKEIASKLNLSINTVLSQMSYAKKNLQNYISNRGGLES